MTPYRCKHAVEAMRWDGERRETLTAWHEKKTGKTPWFREGEIAVAWIGDRWLNVHPSDWLVLRNGSFLVMDDEQFRETYEEVKS